MSCDVNAACSGAACVCKTNYYGDGFTCASMMSPSIPPPLHPSHAHRDIARCGVGCPTEASCTNNIVPGYYFDATAVTLAGETATSTTCAPGLVGYTTRRCLWNGPNSAAGVWENPVSFCQRTLRVRAELGAERGAELIRAG